MKYVLTNNQRKGGVGKSSSTLNLAYAFGARGLRTVVIDLDDQQNTTTSISRHLDASLTVSDLLLNDDVTLSAAAVTTDWPNVRIVAASANLSGAAKHLDAEVGGHLVLKEKLDADGSFDICLIDNSPSMNILNINSLCAATHLFIPLSSKYFSLQGLSQTLAAYNKVKTRLNPELALLGMAFVIHDKRNTLANEIVGKVRGQYPTLAFDAVVGTNIKIEEASVKKQPIFTYAPDDRGAVQYQALADELLARLTAPAQEAQPPAVVGGSHG
jgi:chromosome partitioning protein